MKKTKFSKFVCLLLSFVMIFSVFVVPMNASAASKPTATSSTLTMKNLTVYAYGNKTARVSVKTSDIKQEVYTGRFKYVKAGLEFRTYNSKTKKWSKWEQISGQNTYAEGVYFELYNDYWNAARKALGNNASKKQIQKKADQLMTAGKKDYFKKYVGTYKTFTMSDCIWDDVEIGSNTSKIQFRMITWGCNDDSGYAVVGNKNGKFIYDKKLAETNSDGTAKFNYSKTITYDVKWSGVKLKWFSNGNLYQKYYNLTITNTSTNKSKTYKSSFL